MSVNEIGKSNQGMHFEILPKQYSGMSGPNVVEFVPISIPKEAFGEMVQSLIGRFDNIDAIHRAVSSALDEIERSQAQHAQDHAEIREGFAEIREGFAEIREGFAEIRADQEEIGEGFAEIREGFAEIREDQKEVGAGIERLDIDIKEVGADHVRLNAKVKELERRVSFIEARKLESSDSREFPVPSMQKIQRVLDYVRLTGSTLVVGIEEVSVSIHGVAIRVGQCSLHIIRSSIGRPIGRADNEEIEKKNGLWGGFSGVLYASQSIASICFSRFCSLVFRGTTSMLQCTDRGWPPVRQFQCYKMHIGARQMAIGYHTSANSLIRQGWQPEIFSLPSEEERLVASDRMRAVLWSRSKVVNLKTARNIFSGSLRKEPTLDMLFMSFLCRVRSISSADSCSSKLPKSVPMDMRARSSPSVLRK